RLEQADSDPPSQQVVRAGVQGLLDRAVGRLPVSAGEVQLGRPGSDVGILGLPAGKRFQNLDRLGILSLASLAFGLSQRQGNLELRRQAGLLFFRFALGRQISFLSLGIATVLQEPPRRVRALGVLRAFLRLARQLSDQHQRRQHDPLRHSEFLLALVSSDYQRPRGMASPHLLVARFDSRHKQGFWPSTTRTPSLVQSSRAGWPTGSRVIIRLFGLPSAFKEHVLWKLCDQNASGFGCRRTFRGLIGDDGRRNRVGAEIKTTEGGDTILVVSRRRIVSVPAAN